MALFNFINFTINLFSLEGFKLNKLGLCRPLQPIRIGFA